MRPRSALALAATLPATLAGLAVAIAVPAGATQINTGDADGPYQTRFCPLLQGALAKSKIDMTCAPSTGTAENIERVAKDPRQLGYGQLDVLALTAPKLGGSQAFTRLRVDDVRECIFAVTRRKDITNYGEVAVFAPALRFVVPPESSGSAGTFRFLQQIDPDGVGKAKQVVAAASTEEAIRTALSADDTVAIFVQFPDPASPRFKLIQELGGHVVSVLDRNILRQQLEDRKIYFAQETEVTNTRWLRASRKLVTACTPLVVFTGNSDRITGEQARKDHKDLIATVVTLSPAEILPKETVFQRVLKRSRELTSAGAERVARLTDTAREQAKPLYERAKEGTAKAFEQAKEGTVKAYQRAKEGAAKAYQKAKEGAKELLDKARGTEEPAAPRQ